MFNLLVMSQTTELFIVVLFFGFHACKGFFQDLKWIYAFNIFNEFYSLDNDGCCAEKYFWKLHYIKYIYSLIAQY